MSAARDDWADGIARISAECAGVVALQVVTPEDLPEMLAASLMGDREATRLAHLVAQALRRIEEAPRSRAMLCAACPKRLRGGRYAIVCAVPHRDDPREALTLGVCRRCATRHDAIVQKAGQALKRVWPDLRAIDIHPGRGHA